MQEWGCEVYEVAPPKESKATCLGWLRRYLFGRVDVPAAVVTEYKCDAASVDTDAQPVGVLLVAVCAGDAAPACS
jgi:hypothetical protein